VIGGVAYLVVRARRRGREPLEVEE
jgi:hypothetical protein